MSKQKKKKRKLKISRVILLTLIFLVIIGGGTALGLVISAASSLPDWSAADLEAEKTSFIYDMNDELMMQLHKTENRTPVELEQIPTYLVDAFIATEDVRFEKHHGIDVRRIFGALIADVRNRNFSEGASTITMQLVRNAILEDQEKKIERKIKEALLAIQVESKYTKEEILSMYLNEIFFGHGTHGVQAAAQVYFGKDVQDLTLGESAMLAGLVRNPRTYSPFLNPENSLRIRDTVLNNMVRYNKITSEEAEEAKKESLQLADYNQRSVYAYPWFTDYVIDEAEELLADAGYESSQLYTEGFRIYATMNPEIQKAAEATYEGDSFFPKSNSADPVQSAMAVLDPATGEIRALIGGREHVTKRGLNRATDMKRQPGSVIKPIAVYAPALDKGYTPASVVDDVPVAFGSYKPKNYDGQYRGLISMREAVQYSVNVPAVKFLNQMGISEGFNFAKNLGLPLDDKNDKNLSLALGGLTHGVSPLDLSAAYAAFDNQGVYIEPHAITKICDQKGNTIVDVTAKKHIAMSEQTAYLMTDILKTVVDAGTGTRAKMNRPVAGKTGTTQLPDKKGFQNRTGNKDAWFAGFTPELVGVVWMGYDEDYDENGKAQYLNRVYGGQYPAKIWKSVMDKSLKNAPVKPFPVPSGIVSKAIDIKSGKLPSDLTPDRFIRTEIFSSKNVPTEISDVWVTASICAETGLLVNESCPVKISGVFLKRPEPYPNTGKKPNDADLSLPSGNCALHTGVPVGTSTDLIAVCTDPRHGGALFLANTPQSNEDGGCPQEFVVFISPESDEIPTHYCDLEDHQITRESKRDNNKKNNDKKD
ncbi:MAG: penicillin-binding protein 1A [Desulfitobacteriaceae bacterium]|nr:penicillin-binding protein 1A [Desulfitobacteriaceae bacterium]MDD4752118.1 penicillin-binding protein 1A [Desulfitobacteriaceae bacterium]